MNRRVRDRWFLMLVGLFFCAVGMMLLFRIPVPFEVMGLLAILTGLYAIFQV